jgi:hypothetical protein
MILKIRYFAALQTLYFAQSDWLYQCISLHFCEKVENNFPYSRFIFCFSESSWSKKLKNDTMPQLKALNIALKVRMTQSVL